MADPVRIGLTMRVVQAQGYDEPRDALAQDWADLLAQAFGTRAAWLPVPNLGAGAARAWCEQWGIGGLILTGGEDPGACPRRDETELDLLEWARERSLPVLGICRGMQLMAVHAGGSLKPVAGHVRARHSLSGALAGTVNSYHALALAACPPGYGVLATAEDGEIEAMAHAQRRWAGWMWHPERERPASPADLARLREMFL